MAWSQRGAPNSPFVGAVVFVAPPCALQKFRPVLAMFMLSSGAGKWTALSHGHAATRMFCRLNLGATMCLVTMCALHSDWPGVCLWGSFALAYATFGFSESASNMLVPEAVAANMARVCRVSAVCMVGGCLASTLVLAYLGKLATVNAMFWSRLEGAGLPEELR